MKKNIIIALLSICWLALFTRPASAQVSVGVTITAGFPPPPLVVYEQPPCPIEGYIWCPGYWAYTDDGYFWVPGVWVMPPRYGYLWTPPWWGYEAGVYGFHPGYWGPHVGYYGGVHYGYGYTGTGFVGGRWEGNQFRYNTAVVNVNRTVIHNTYVDRTVIVKNTSARTSYNGGPGGIATRPPNQERAAIGETRLQPTAEQTAHMQQARSNRAQFATASHGKPATVVMNQPVHVQHESVRTKPVQPYANLSAHQRQYSPSDNHLNAANNHAHNQTQKLSPPSNPRHYIPITEPKPVPQQQHMPAQPERAMPQQQHAAPQPERMAPQQQHMPPPQHMNPHPQQMHAPQRQHMNPPPHNPEKNR